MIGKGVGGGGGGNFIINISEIAGVTGLRVPRIMRPAGLLVLEFCVRRTASPRSHCPPGHRILG